MGPASTLLFFQLLFAVSGSLEDVDPSASVTECQLLASQRDPESRHCSPDTPICSIKADSTDLQLVCAVCPDGVGIEWSKCQAGSSDFVPLPKYNRKGTITIQPKDVMANLSGCYKCYCDYSGKELWGFISLVVRPAADGLPYPLVRSQRDGSGNYHLSRQIVPLNLTSRGRVCVNASCKGSYLDYAWYRHTKGGWYEPLNDCPDKMCYYSNDNENGDASLSANMLTPSTYAICYLPTVSDLHYFNSSLQTIKVVVCEKLKEVCINIFVEISFPDINSLTATCSWFARPHEKQSFGRVTIADGEGTAYCGAYHEDLNTQFEYFVYELNHDVAEHDPGIEACYQRSQEPVANCSTSSQNQNQSDRNTPRPVSCNLQNVSNHLAMRSTLGIVKIKKAYLKGKTFACIARRRLNSLGNSLLSEENVLWSDPMLLGTFEFVENPETTASPTVTVVALESSLGILSLGVVFVAIAFVVVAAVYWGRRRRRIPPEPHRQQGGANGVREDPGSNGGTSLSSLSSSIRSSRSRKPSMYGAMDSSQFLDGAPQLIAAEQSVGSTVASLVESDTQSIVAEIDISASPVPSQPGAAGGTRTASHSKVLLPAGKTYDFQHSGQDRKIRVYTDILPPRRDASHKDIFEVPKLIDKLVPVTLMILMDFVPDLAAVWDKVGIKLDLHNKVDMLFKQQGDVCTNLTAIFSVWIRKGKNVSWSYLLQQLESPGVDKNNVANDIRDYLCRQVPEVPDNIDFLYPVTIESLMPLVAPCTEHWECIAEALMLQKLVDQLQKDDTIDGPYVKTAAIFHHWINAYGDEASWVNILASFGARPELLPLVPGIKQHLMQQVYEMYKAVPDRIRP